MKVGDTVSEGSTVLLLETAGAAGTPRKETVRQDAAPAVGAGQPGYGSPSGVYEVIEVKVPDIGDFKDVPIVEVHVKPGAEVQGRGPADHAGVGQGDMDMPAPIAGTVAEVSVKPGDRVSEGSLDPAVADGGRCSRRRPPAPTAPAPKPPSSAKGDLHAEVLVLGAGPGGYTAAFRAADLGKKVVLVERWPQLGGVCLNVGCIPSKALLHAAKVISETQEMGAHGLSFAAPSIDLDKLRGWKDGVVKRLTGGLGGLARQRKVTVVEGVGQFLSPNQVEVRANGSARVVSFDQAIIAAGSEPVTPAVPAAWRPAGHRQHRRAGDGRNPEAAAGDRRRDHRAGDGDRLSRARRQGDGGRADGPDHSGRRPGHGDAADEADREAVRGDLPQDEGDEGGGWAGRHHGAFRGREGAVERRRSTGCWWRSGGGRTGG